MAIIQTLELSDTNRRNLNADKTLSLRRRFLESLDHQIALAQAQQKGEPYFVVVEKWMESDTLGKKARVKVQKTVKPWWFRDATDRVLLEIRVGNRRIDIAGKASVVCGTIEQLVPTLEIIRKAAQASELDSVLKNVADGRRRGRKVGATTSTEKPASKATK